MLCKASEDRRKGSLYTVKLNNGSFFVHISLPKFLKGNNFESLTLWEIREAINALESSLRISSHLAQVVRIEAAITLPVNLPPSEYMQEWGSFPRMQKDVLNGGSTVRFSNGTWSIQGYDKILENGLKEVPPGYAPHALRIELKRKKNVSGLFENSLFLSDLSQPNIYVHLIKLFITAYQRIPKLGCIKLATQPLTTNSLKTELARIGCQSVGSVRLESSIRSNVSSGLIGRREGGRMRSMLRDLLQQTTHNTSPLAHEVNTLVQTLTNRYISSALVDMGIKDGFE